MGDRLPAAATATVVEEPNHTGRKSGDEEGVERPSDKQRNDRQDKGDEGDDIEDVHGIYSSTFGAARGIRTPILTMARSHSAIEL